MDCTTPYPEYALPEPEDCGYALPELDVLAGVFMVSHAPSVSTAAKPSTDPNLFMVVIMVILKG
jgi:hypothetical protein